jgi:DNA repair exonuclease SbcCD ATPase subunit
VSPERSSIANEYETSKQTQIALIKSPYVLNAALRNPKIQKLPVIQKQEKPFGFLRQALDISNPGGSEMLQVSLYCGDDVQSTKILQSIVEAYLIEVAIAERSERTQRLETLRREQRELVREIQEKSKIIHNLAEEVGTSDSELAKLNQRLEEARLQAMGRRKDDLIAKLEEVQDRTDEHEATKNIDPFAPSAEDIAAYLEQYPEYLQTKKELEEVEKIMRNSIGSLVPGSPSQKRLQSHIESAADELQKMRDGLEPRVIHQLRRAHGDDDDDRNATASEALDSQIAFLQRRIKRAT